MRRLTMLLLALLCLLLLPGAQIIVPPRPSGTPACTAATYAAIAALPAPADGTLCTAEDTTTPWEYCTGSGGYWQPPGTCPVGALLSDYDGSVMPNTVGWLLGVFGTDTAAVAGGELTLTDTTAGYMCLCFRDTANIIATKNVAAIVRMKVTAQSADTAGGKEWMGYAWGTATTQTGTRMAGGPALGVGNMAPAAPFNTLARGVTTPDNSVYANYMIAHRAATKTTELWRLGDSVPIFILDDSSFPAGSTVDAPCNVSNTFGISFYSGSYSSTYVIDWIKLFNF